MQRLVAFIRSKHLDVVVIDPVYLAWRNESGGKAGTGTIENGQVLERASRACLDEGATPVFVHHAGKTAARRRRVGEELDLDDLLDGGFAEFARGWALVNRREKFILGSGKHYLNFAFGGSDGFSGKLEVDVDEGPSTDDDAGATWVLKARRVDPAKLQAQEKRHQDPAEDDATVLEYLGAHPEGETVAEIIRQTVLSKDRVNRAVNRLAEAKKIEQTTVMKPGRNKDKRTNPQTGWRLVRAIVPAGGAVASDAGCNGSVALPSPGTPTTQCTTGARSTNGVNQRGRRTGPTRSNRQVRSQAGVRRARCRTGGEGRR